MFNTYFSSRSSSSSLVSMMNLHREKKIRGGLSMKLEKYRNRRIEKTEKDKDKRLNYL